MLARLIQQQQRWSAAFERRLPPALCTHGFFDFGDRVVPGCLSPGICIFDFGGGKRPTLDAAAKAALGATMVGVDIDAQELARAPEGTYDRTITADLAAYRGQGEADLVICRALLEHVADVPGAFQAIATTLRPGGRALLFVPSRNAAFARLNLLLPERLKRWLLFTVFPGSEQGQGFPAYYRQCTPRQCEAQAHAVGLEVEARHLYWYSNYFSFLLPLHVLWRGWTMLFRTLAPVQSAETFTLVLRKPEVGDPSGDSLR